MLEKRINVKMTAGERQQLHQQAKAQNTTLSNLVRQKCGLPQVPKSSGQ